MNEEYEDALALAQQYGLNCDLVYQRQWHSYPVTVETIEAYLVSGCTEYKCIIRIYVCYRYLLHVQGFPTHYSQFRHVLLYPLVVPGLSSHFCH